MISKSLSVSGKWADLDSLSPQGAEFARVLFMLMVAHADDHGRLEGDEGTIKRLVVPYTKKPPSRIGEALDLLHRAELICWYQVSGDKFVQINKFGDHQYLKGHESRESKYPAPSPDGQLRATLGKKRHLIEPNLTEEKRTVLEPPPQKPEPDSRVKVFVDWFHDEYAKRRDGAKYVVKGAKDGQLVKTLLQTHDLERLKKHAVILLTSNEEWIETTDRGIGILAAKINWLEDRLTAWEKKHG